MTYFILFLTAFGAATFLPLGSEALFLYDIKDGYSLPFLWFVASVGNTLGSMFNYWLGLKGEVYLKKRGHLSSKKVQKAKIYFDHYGGWTLLLSWMPVIGDPLTFIAGVLRYNFKWFTAIVFVAKATRYAVVGLLLKGLFL